MFFQRSISTLVLLFLFSLTSFAAFPIRPLANEVKIVQITSVNEKSVSHPVVGRTSTFFKKIARPLMPGKHGPYREGSPLVSILSFVFSGLGLIMIPFGIAAIFAGSFSAFGIAVIAAFLFLVAGLVLGIIALATHLPCKGLAIAGVVLSGGLLLLAL